jgi:alpha-1,6-mannosyltransferase
MKSFRATTVVNLLKGPNVLLIVLGCASLTIYLWSLRAHSSADMLWFLKLVVVESGLFIISCWLTLRAQAKHSTLLIVIVFAVLFHLSLLFAPPYLSDDIYRYIWDGRVQAAGINPYRYIPAEQPLAHLRDEQIYPRINHRDNAHTMYPPVAEGTWLLTTRISESVTWMKATMILFEGVAICAIVQLLASFGLPRQRILLYAWHPLAVWEFAGSGHVDAIAIAFISLALLARRREAQIATGLTLASATLVKLFPVILFPAFYKRGGWKMPLVFALTIVVAYLPYLGVGPRGVLGFLPGYARERGMLSGEQFFLLAAIRRVPLGFHIPTSAFIVFAVLILAALAVWMLRKHTSEKKDYISNTLIMASAFTVLLSPHFPWYFAWLLPFLCLVPSVPVIYLTLSSFLLYLTWIYWTDDQVLRIKAAIFIPFFILVTFSLWKARAEFRTRVPAVESIPSEKHA